MNVLRYCGATVQSRAVNGPLVFIRSTAGSRSGSMFTSRPWSTNTSRLACPGVTSSVTWRPPLAFLKASEAVLAAIRGWAPRERQADPSLA